MHLDMAELLIAVVLEDFTEQAYLVILILKVIDSVQQPLHLLDDERPQPILLIQVSIKVLLHCLPSLVAFLAVSIELDLLTVNVIECDTQLF